MTPTTKPGDTDYVVLESPRDADIQPDGETVPKQASTTDASLVSLSQLFTFADATDKALIAVGTVGALAAGLSQPIQIVLFGDILNSFNPDPRDGPVTPEDFRANINEVARNFAIVGVAVIVCCFLQVTCWSLTASRQAKRIRSAYVGAIVSTEIGWFDVNEPMQLPTRVVESTVAIEEGMGRKIGDGVHFVSMAVSGITIGFVKGWELALVLLALAPFIACAAFLSMKVMSTATQTSIESYASAGAIAQESLSNIRTVHMFNAIQHFVRKYERALELSTQAGIKKGFAVGWGTGIMFFAIFSMYACGMFYGALKVVNDRRDGCTEDCYNGGRVLTVFFSVIMGAMAIGQAGPSVQAVFSARVAAFDVLATINRKSAIDPLSDEGVKLAKVEGKIEILDVTFSYPSRSDVQVCSNYSLTIAAGETVALVGPSGSGKSTVVALLERFYDPLSGSVKIDGVDARELNVKWLRSQIGLVGQEPVLFAASITENIRYGSQGASDEDVVNAAKMANAYAFIMDFPQGFQTEVGERGALLSGGQKQRIAIARAIIKNPPILLLDEATSALDTDSEHIVQESLAKLLASSRRTTIIVAHRLSTICNADKIAVHSSGSIVEFGTHDELMEDPNGHYRMLVEAQNRTKEGILKEMSGGHSTADDPVPTAPTKPMGGIVSVKDSDVEPLDDELQPVAVSRVWKLSLPEWKFFVFGALGAVVNASVFPVWGVLLTKVTVLFFDDSPRSEILRSARLWSLGFVGLGVVCGASIVLQHYGFAVASQRLTSRVRLATFTAMLHQEVGWFDLDENSSGALVSRLATDSATLQAMTSETLNQRLVNTTTLAIGFGIAFYYSWQMTLLLLATAPILLFNSYIQAQVLSGTINSKKNNDADTAAGSLLSEAIGSIRTVASFGMETAIKSSYASFLDTSKKDDAKTGIVGGVAFGVSQGIVFFNCAFQFYMGGKWVSDGVITFEDMFMVITVIVLCSFAVGMASQNASDQHNVKKAASRVFRIIDRTPAVDSTTASGNVLPSVVGEIEFGSIEFAYPSRPEAKIYTNYNLKVSSGQTVALVGASGSGKSTAVSLLERFYDPAVGSVTLDGVDLRELQLPWLREHVSLVSQEPVLFTGTIAENIAMGKPGATREEVVEAAKKANAFDFICNFSDGFDTDVGDRGAQVSGGQKQRIAIARAILRDPEVLLLDEATSALDNESERVVQESLDRLLTQKKRTTIIVAHRLSTIRNADLIAVTKDGEIVEQGTHDELMARSTGVYKALVARQVGAVQG